jgi:catechol 2,3-dioxygenase-like lactoylglutathione lyase family enzyme
MDRPEPPCRLHFVELSVGDWAASLAWYRDALGLAVELLDEPRRFALLAAGPCRVALKEGTPSPGGALLAFEVDRLARYESLGGETKASDEGYRRLRLHDPDGYSVVLFEWSAG